MLLALHHEWGHAGPFMSRIKRGLSATGSGSQGRPDGSADVPQKSRAASSSSRGKVAQTYFLVFLDFWRTVSTSFLDIFTKFLTKFAIFLPYFNLNRITANGVYLRHRYEVTQRRSGSS